jgi:hypothetical protein
MKCAGTFPLGISVLLVLWVPVTASAQNSQYPFDRLFLMEPSATPAGEVLTFNSEVGVANYFARGSEQARLATEFFRGYTGSSANMLFNNLVQTENDQWSSFQDVYNPTSATPPGERATLKAWDQSSGGNYTFLENWSSTTPPIVDSMVASDARLLAAAPEPSTWTMVVLGFAGLGLALYRTKTIKESTATQGPAP